MSAHIVYANNRLHRTANIVASTSPFTCMLWFCCPSVVTTSFSMFVSTNGPFGSGGSYAQAGALYSGTSLECFTPSDDEAVTYFIQNPVIANVWKHYCYTRSGTTQTFYINGTLVGSVSVDFTGFPFSETFLGDDNTTGSGNTCLFSNYREWNVALSAAQINAEIASTASVVNTDGLVAFTPLTSDGTDHSGNGNNWTAVGSVTYVADPVFPTNFCPNTATLVTNGSSVSQSQSFANSTVGSTFYRYLVQTTDAALSGFSFGALGAFEPFVNLISPSFQSMANSLVGNDPVYINPRPAWALQSVYVESIPDGTLTVPTVVFKWAVFTNPSSAPAGLVGIPSTSLSRVDGVPWPTSLVNTSAEETVALVPFPISTAAHAISSIAVLPNGVSAAMNGSGQVDIYSAAYVRTATVTLPGGATGFTVSSDNTSQFFVRYLQGGHYKLQAISQGGALGATVYDLGTTAVVGFGVNTAATVAYYYSASAVKKWDLVNNVSLGNLVASAPSITGDFLVLQDNSVVFGSFANSRIYQFDGTSGAQLHAFTIPGSGTFQGSDRLSIGTNATWFAHYHLPGSQPQFVITYSTVSGSFATNVSYATTAGGASNAAPSATPVLFGPDTTCPIFVTQTVLNPQPLSGTTDPIRRMRRFSLPFQNNLLLFLRRLEFLIQSGVGLSSGQGSDPVMMVRISGDGGMTWSQELSIGFGKMGEFTHRAILHQLGQASNFVVEVTVTDPVFVAFLDCFADLQEGAW